MNQLEGLLILLGLPAGLLLTGYWLAAQLRDTVPGERLAFALPAGLVTLLALIAAVNFFRPLAGVWAYACLAPVLATLLLPAMRRNLWSDVCTAWRERQNHVLIASGLFFACLLWPVLQNPSALFYDGTSNHDSFFWISGAEHLKRNTYMELPQLSATQPLTNSTPAIIGWKPDWGRMGAEGLLAMVSSVIGLSPLKLFLYATASLQFTWVALAWLALRTFYGPLSARPIAAALVCLQPVFVFFYGNSNLPNLLGTLAGAILIIATQRALKAERGGGAGYLLFVVLSLHGLMCAYPEMLPFVLLPAGLLWLRRWFVTGSVAAWRPCLALAAAFLLGAVLNPVTTVRAANGFIASFAQARADSSWANLFNPLVPAEYLPALTTLSVPAARSLGNWAGGLVSFVIAAGGVLVFRFARDRFGLLAAFSGTLLLIVYTVVTDFAYGWQKSVQFSGVFFGMVFPAATLDAINRSRTGPVAWRLACATALGGLVLYLGYATAMDFREGYKWSERKVISSDWFALRERSLGDLRGATVLVEPATFRMAFFHGMWAAYFLRESHIYYAARGEENGGYLRNHIRTELHPAMPPPSAHLVGRSWADTFDANSPRLLTGREYTLLQKANRVTALSGVQPLNGSPDFFSPNVTMEIVPHSASLLVVEILPHTSTPVATGEWRLTRHVEGHEDYTATVSGPPPWPLRLPLVAGQSNRLTFGFAGADGGSDSLSFQVRTLRIEDAP